jgi:hypothetical protein
MIKIKILPSKKQKVKKILKAVIETSKTNSNENFLNFNET